MPVYTIILCCFQEKVDVAVAQERVGYSNTRIAARARALTANIRLDRYFHKSANEREDINGQNIRYLQQSS